MPRRETPATSRFEIAPFPADPHEDLAVVNNIAKVRRTEKWQKIKTNTLKVIGSICLGSLIATGSTTAYIQRDINEGKREVANSHPSIHDIYSTINPELRQVGTYVATGMGTKNSSETAEKLTAHQETGNVYAIEYNNKEIDIYELTDTIVAHAHEHGVKYISFDGYSAGGPISLAIAAEIHERYDDLSVKSIILNSSPIGEGSLSTQSDEGGRILGTALHYWPGLAYSKKAHHAAEVIARNDRYFNSTDKTFSLDALRAEIANVKREKIDDHDAARSSLIASQINLIYRYMAKKDIARLSQVIDGKPRPQLFATYGSDPAVDSVVDNIKSASNLEEIVNEYFMPLKIIYTDNIGHANPGERPTEYNNTIINSINPHILSSLLVDHSVGGEPEYGDAMYTLPPAVQPQISESTEMDHSHEQLGTPPTN